MPDSAQPQTVRGETPHTFATWGSVSSSEVVSGMVVLFMQHRLPTLA